MLNKLGRDEFQTHYSALKVSGEIFTDMARWPSAKHFTSWLALAPNNKISGGRLRPIALRPFCAAVR